MTAFELASEIARGIYGVGLLLLGCGSALGLLRFGPVVLRVVMDLSAAITLAAGALRQATTSHEAVARIERQVGEIHAAIVVQKTSQVVPVLRR